MEFSEIKNKIRPADKEAMAAAKARWDAVAKPLGSLGLLESAVIKIAGLTGLPDVDIRKRAVVVMCADNGVVEEGVTQTGQEITALVAGNIAKGKASVCRMAEIAGAEVIAVDIGMAYPAERVFDRRIASGTRNMAKEPAMTREEAVRAVMTGVDIVRELKESGFGLLATGEMGIGNTTSSSALAAVLLGLPAEEVTGRGAGLSDAGLERKISAINKAIGINSPDASDALDTLAKVGGFDIAGLAGVFIGGAIYRVPVLIDGFISAISALTAERLCPGARCAMLASHVSAEPAAKLVLRELELEPMIYANMRLGEGTGAVCAMPLLDMGLAVYNEMSTFSDIGMEAYTEQGAGK